MKSFQIRLANLLFLSCFFGPPAFAWLGPFMENPGPAIVDPNIRKTCGDRTQTFAMRAFLQPKTDWGNSQTKPVVEVALRTDETKGPELSLLSKKLAEHLKEKKNKVLSVVFKEIGHKLMDATIPESLEPCLIDGQTVKYWFNNEK